MCGILGSINMPFDVVFLDQIKHRGPDDFGIEKYYIDSNSVNFGHRRLSIVDLSDSGHQPMTSRCKNYSLIFNGEIYNHLELKKTLPDDIDFKGHSDTETILYYIKEFGIEAIKDFNGIFALAYLDIPNKILYLARDRFGVKPLYFYYESNMLLFSSELAPLASKLIPQVDLGTLGNCLMMRYYPAPFTPLKDIFKLEPGQVISIDLKSENLDLKQFFFVNKSPNIGTNNSDHSYLVKTYGDLFENAVERQLMADVDVGLLLSGGVDSALVAAVAQSKSKQKLKAFTVGYADKINGIDETEYARQTAHTLQLDHFVVTCDFEDFLGSVRKIMEIVEEPIATTSIIPMYFLSKLASSRVKVVLSGQGADEPLGGYFKHKFLPILQTTRNLKSSKPLVKYAEPYCQKSEHVRRFVAAITAEDIVKSYMSFNSICSLPEVYDIINSEYSESFLKETVQKQNEFLEILRRRAPLNLRPKDLFPFYDLRTSLPDDLLMYTDKITMRFGLECRVPILDNELIDFIESLPSKKKYNCWNGKIIHKAFAREYLPSSIINRKKIGFSSPSEVWFRKNKDDIGKIFDANQSFKKIFSISKVNDLLRAHVRGVNLEKQIFLLLGVNYLLSGLDNKKAILNTDLVRI